MGDDDASSTFLAVRRCSLIFFGVAVLRAPSYPMSPCPPPFCILLKECTFLSKDVKLRNRRCVVYELCKSEVTFSYDHVTVKRDNSGTEQRFTSTILEMIRYEREDNKLLAEA